jgi:hypothetical protein
VHERDQKCTSTQHSSRGQDNIKIDIVEIECAELNCTYLTSDRDQAWEITDKVMKLQLHKRHSKSFILYSTNVHVVIEY